MSAQLPDRLLFQGKEFDVISTTPFPLFNPAQWGLKPVSSNASCTRGTVAVFQVKDDDSLFLKKLRCWTSQVPPATLGKGKAVEDGHGKGCVEYVYEESGAILPWSGEIVMGRTFLWPLLLPRGFQSAWKYKEVMRLLFVEGSLHAFGDVSKKMARLRADVVETVQGAVGF